MIRVFKTRNFVRWAKKEKVANSTLIDAVRDIQDGLIDADLGGGLMKKRIARQGQGKRGGYRTLIAFKRTDLAIFLFGFSKKDRDNLDKDEEKVYKELTHYYLSLNDEKLSRMVKENMLYEVTDEKIR